MLYGEGIVHIELEEEDHMLDEVLFVSGRIQNVKSVQLGMETVSYTHLDVYKRQRFSLILFFSLYR